MRIVNPAFGSVYWEGVMLGHAALVDCLLYIVSQYFVLWARMLVLDSGHVLNFFIR